ncbi:unnamed protein product [Adineta ricciae]|uniref:Uncharacterized protein n=1 Tax=Adineta ricciae TaxID=249248 RepID=A0A815DQE5_ADIRI|nr:unnamed protein product [Adineta ricciae]CAF1417099.1 unnamed protein product [Adineta ricciae]
MLFLNGRARNAAVSGFGLHSQNYTQKVGHSCIVGGCLSIVTGLILIVVGVISEVKKTTYIGAGVIGLGVGCFLVTLVCFYAKLDICYNNWAYRARVLPASSGTPQANPPSTTARSPLAAEEKLPSAITPDMPAPLTTISDVEVHKFPTDSIRKQYSITVKSENVP